MLKKYYCLVFINIIFIFNSCENLNEPGSVPFNNSVLINLKTGNAKQQFFIYKTLDINYQFSSYPFYDLDEVFDSSVEINISDGIAIYDDFHIEFTDSTLKRRCYSNLSEYVVEPDKEYYLNILSKDQLINGRIRTIGDFDIININKNNAKLDIVWENCRNAKLYELSIRSYYLDSVIIGYENGNFVWDFTTVSRSISEFIETDSLIQNNNRYIVSKTIVPNIDSAIVTIKAYDLNIYNHLVKGVKKVGIENAYGYFGSSTVKEMKWFK